MDTRYGAVVLCGGESSRMGRVKAWLPWGPDATMLQHVVGILQKAVPTKNICVASGFEQRVPALPTGVRQVEDLAETGGTGPLAALMSGLACFDAHVQIAFACSCDAPLLKSEFVDKMLGLLDDGADVVVPTDGERLYPLAAAYHKKCGLPLYQAFCKGERSLHRMLQSGGVRVREVRVDALRSVDPELDSLVNCNTPEEYEWALERAGLSG
jgi:molybdenum cofactor guanylyltransferase